MNTSPSADLAVVVGALVLASTALALSGSLPQLSADPAGLALWPRILGSVVVAAGLVVLGGRIRAMLRRGGARTAPRALPDRPGLGGLPMVRATVCGVLCVVYAWLVAMLGFSLPSFLFVASLMLFFGARPIETLAYAVAMTVGLHLFFFRVLGATPPSRDWLVATIRSWF